jgi:arabinogalactan oligomer/maltooligosaccharide transport system substrate-binding protein
MKRLFPILTLLAASSALLFAGGAKETTMATEEGASLAFWQTMNEQETETLRTIVNEFKTAHPEIEVAMEYVPFGDAQNKFKTAAAAGNAPDVIRAEIAWTPEFADLGYLLDITGMVSNADKADYLEAPFAYNKYDGKIWGIPQVTDAPALLYNKALLRQAGHQAPPATLAEMERIVADVRSRLGIEGFYMRGDSYWLQCFIWAFGGGLIDNNRKVLINSPQSVAGLQYVLDQKGKLFPAEIDFANDYGNAMALFKDGKVAMIINGPWATADVLSGEAFEDPANLGVAPFPKGPRGDQGSPVGGHNYTIYSGTLYPESAYTFIEFINQTKYQALLAVRNNLLPTRQSAYDDPSVKSNALVQGFLGQMKVATNRPVIPEGGQIYTAFTPAYQSAWRGEKTAKQALDEVAAAWNKLLGN